MNFSQLLPYNLLTTEIAIESDSEKHKNLLAFTSFNIYFSISQYLFIIFPPFIHALFTMAALDLCVHDI